MLAVSLLVLLTTGASGAKVALVERSTLGLSAKDGARLRAQLAAALAEEELVAEQVTPACASRECLLDQARSRGSCVVGVTLVKSRKGLTVDLEAVDAAHVVLQQTFLLSGPSLERSPEARVFAHQLATRLGEDDQRPASADRPVVEPTPSLVPTERTREPAPELELEPARVSSAPRALAIGGASAGAVAIGLLVASAVVKGALDTALAERPVVTTLTRAQAQQQADTANGLLAGGVIGLGVGLALGATAVVVSLP